MGFNRGWLKDVTVGSSRLSVLGRATN